MSSSPAPDIEAEIGLLVSQAGDDLRQCPDDHAFSSYPDTEREQFLPEAMGKAEPAPDRDAPSNSWLAGSVQASAMANATCRAHDFRIQDEDRIGAPVTAVLGSRRFRAPLSKALLLAVTIGWMAGLASYYLFELSYPVNSAANKERPADRPEKKEAGNKEASMTRQTSLAPNGPSSERAAPAATVAHADRTEAIPLSTTPRSNGAKLAKQNSRPTTPNAITSQRKLPSTVMPAPETRPVTIQGWAVQRVVDGAAVLQGPNGVRKVSPGDVVPELGRIDSIVKWGPRWIVATSNGLITNP